MAYSLIRLVFHLFTSLLFEVSVWKPQIQTKWNKKADTYFWKKSDWFGKSEVLSPCFPSWKSSMHRNQPKENRILWLSRVHYTKSCKVSINGIGPILTYTLGKGLKCHNDNIYMGQFWSLPMWRDVYSKTYTSGKFKKY